MRNARAADELWSDDPHPEDRFIRDFFRRLGPCSKRDRELAIVLCQSLFDLHPGVDVRDVAVGIEALLADAGLTQCARARALAGMLCSRTDRVRRIAPTRARGAAHGNAGLATARAA